MQFYFFPMLTYIRAFIKKVAPVPNTYLCVFLCSKILQILNHLSGLFQQAKTSYFWRVCFLFIDLMFIAKQPNIWLGSRCFYLHFFCSCKCRRWKKSLKWRKITLYKKNVWNALLYSMNVNNWPLLDIPTFFRQITTFIKVCVAFLFGLQTL